MSKRKIKRTNESSTLVAVWVPDNVIAKIDAIARENDSDRSKVIRRAIRTAISRPV